MKTPRKSVTGASEDDDGDEPAGAEEREADDGEEDSGNEDRVMHRRLRRERDAAAASR